jgi:uncharacterized protein (DUF1810 family)
MSTLSHEPFPLDHFISAQEPVYDQVRAELRAGRKRSHWMWFIFPQLAGLGRSSTARYYGLASLAHARAFLGHPVLGPRLRECTALAIAAKSPSALALMGTPDDLKLRSSMTLFAHADPAQPLFRECLDQYFGGQPDPLTLELLAQRGN